MLWYNYSYYSVCQFHWCVRVAVCHVSKEHDRNIHFTLCVRVSFSLVCLCGGVSCFKRLWYNNSYSVIQCHWCVRVVVCHALKSSESYYSVCPCGGVFCFKILWYNYSYYSVCPCGGVSRFKMLWYNYSYYSVCQFHGCVRVAVCHVSKEHDRNIHLTLRVRVSFSLVCLCGGVSCFKRLWYNNSYSVIQCHWCVRVAVCPALKSSDLFVLASVCHSSKGYSRNIFLILCFQLTNVMFLKNTVR